MYLSGLTPSEAANRKAADEPFEIADEISTRASKGSFERRNLRLVEGNLFESIIEAVHLKCHDSETSCIRAPKVQSVCANALIFGVFLFENTVVTKLMKTLQVFSARKYVFSMLQIVWHVMFFSLTKDFLSWMCFFLWFLSNFQKLFPYLFLSTDCFSLTHALVPVFSMLLLFMRNCWHLSSVSLVFLYHLSLILSYSSYTL